MPPIIHKKGASQQLRSTGGSTGKPDPYPAEILFNGRKMAARITLRQAVPYDMVHQQNLLEEKIHRGEVRMSMGSDGRTNCGWLWLSHCKTWPPHTIVQPFKHQA